MTHGIGRVADDSVKNNGVNCSYCGLRIQDPDIVPDYIFCPRCGKFFNLKERDSAAADKNTKIEIYKD